MDADWNLKVDPPPSIDPLYVTTNGNFMYLLGQWKKRIMMIIILTKKKKKMYDVK